MLIESYSQRICPAIKVRNFLWKGRLNLFEWKRQYICGLVKHSNKNHYWTLHGRYLRCGYWSFKCIFNAVAAYLFLPNLIFQQIIFRATNGMHFRKTHLSGSERHRRTTYVCVRVCNGEMKQTEEQRRAEEETHSGRSWTQGSERDWQWWGACGRTFP